MTHQSVPVRSQVDSGGWLDYYLTTMGDGYVAAKAVDQGLRYGEEGDDEQQEEDVDGRGDSDGGGDSST